MTFNLLCEIRAPDLRIDIFSLPVRFFLFLPLSSILEAAPFVACRRRRIMQNYKFKTLAYN
jgi:hypothetical protein